jgi:hypothetical protein
MKYTLWLAENLKFFLELLSRATITRNVKCGGMQVWIDDFLTYALDRGQRSIAAVTLSRMSLVLQAIFWSNSGEVGLQDGAGGGDGE